MNPDALLVLADGELFEGEAIGAAAPDGIATGEVVFNTVMSGYQEVLTDPSYAGQIITFTYPHIGNYGINTEDNESRKAFCNGVIVRDNARRPSNWRSAESLQEFLVRQGVPGITGIDTRRLTRHIRDTGSMPAAFGTADESSLRAAAASAASTDGVDLVERVTTQSAYSTGEGPFNIVAYDFGIKTTILSHLGRLGKVEIVPASTSAADVLALQPDGVFLSNGPGDPSAVTYAIDSIKQLLGQVPVFGICLGHQLLGLALGGSTYKLNFGHHGGNHPVRRLETKAVEITSQNHNYAIAEGSLKSADVTHVNLNDGVIEGIRSNDIPAFGIQYHPEAGPGPHDAQYLFEEFSLLMGRSMRRTSDRRQQRSNSEGSA